MRKRIEFSSRTHVEKDRKVGDSVCNSEKKIRLVPLFIGTWEEEKKQDSKKRNATSTPRRRKRGSKETRKKNASLGSLPSRSGSSARTHAYDVVR